MMNIKWFIIFSIILLGGCAIDDDIPIDPCLDDFIGSFDLLPTSDDVFPYLALPIATSRIIFENEADEEVVYIIESLNEITTTSTLARPCPVNEEDEIDYTYISASKVMILSSDNNSIDFRLSLRTQLDLIDPASGGVSDVFSFSAFDTFSGFQGSQWNRFFSLGVDKRTSSHGLYIPQFHETLQLLNKTFTNVYVSDDENSLCYTKEQGIVAFKDIDDQLWVLDRIE